MILNLFPDTQAVVHEGAHDNEESNTGNKALHLLRDTQSFNIASHSSFHKITLEPI